MDFQQAITITICIATCAVVYIPLIIVGTKMRFRAADREYEMRRLGTYAAWLSQNRQRFRWRKVIYVTMISSVCGAVLLAAVGNFVPFAGILAGLAFGLFVVLIPVTAWIDWRMHNK